MIKKHISPVSLILIAFLLIIPFLFACNGPIKIIGAAQPYGALTGVLRPRSYLEKKDEQPPTRQVRPGHPVVRPYVACTPLEMGKRLAVRFPSIAVAAEESQCLVTVLDPGEIACRQLRDCGYITLIGLMEQSEPELRALNKRRVRDIPSVVDKAIAVLSAYDSEEYARLLVAYTLTTDRMRPLRDRYPALAGVIEKHREVSLGALGLNESMQAALYRAWSIHAPDQFLMLTESELGCVRGIGKGDCLIRILRNLSLLDEDKTGKKILDFELARLRLKPFAARFPILARTGRGLPVEMLGLGRHISRRLHQFGAGTIDSLLQITESGLSLNPHHKVFTLERLAECNTTEGAIKLLTYGFADEKYIPLSMRYPFVYAQAQAGEHTIDELGLKPKHVKALAEYGIHTPEALLRHTQFHLETIDRFNSGGVKELLAKLGVMEEQGMRPKCDDVFSAAFLDADVLRPAARADRMPAWTLETINRTDQFSPYDPIKYAAIEYFRKRGYEIVAALPSGGSYWAGYRAYDLRLKRWAAIMVSPPGPEPARLPDIDIPIIAHTYGVDTLMAPHTTTDDAHPARYPCHIMEYVPGRPLSYLIARGYFYGKDPVSIISYFETFLRGLRQTHEAGYAVEGSFLARDMLYVIGGGFRLASGRDSLTSSNDEQARQNVRAIVSMAKDVLAQTAAYNRQMEDLIDDQLTSGKLSSIHSTTEWLHILDRLRTRILSLRHDSAPLSFSTSVVYDDLVDMRRWGRNDNDRMREYGRPGSPERSRLLLLGRPKIVGLLPAQTLETLGRILYHFRNTCRYPLAGWCYPVTTVVFSVAKVGIDPIHISILKGAGLQAGYRADLLYPANRKNIFSYPDHYLVYYYRDGLHCAVDATAPDHYKESPDYRKPDAEIFAAASFDELEAMLCLYYGGMMWVEDTGSTAYALAHPPADALMLIDHIFGPTRHAEEQV